MNSTRSVTAVSLQMIAFRVALGLLLTLMTGEFIAILIINQGHFFFTLDDPYIHLAVSENLWHAHYGVNLEEFSSPSSSMLWPFLIAPFALFPDAAPILILLFNGVVATATLRVFWLILKQEPGTSVTPPQAMMLGALLIAMMLIANLVGLVYTGMEHSLQVLLCSLIVLGLIKEFRDAKLPDWLPWVLILAPMVRYECLGVSIPALVVLWSKGYRKPVWLSILGILVALGSFSLFLLGLGLPPLPTSVLVKSSIFPTSSFFHFLQGHLTLSYQHHTGRLLGIGMVILLYVSTLRGIRSDHGRIALSVAAGIGLHVLFGRYDWYGRYEIYIWSLMFLSLLYLFKDALFSMASHMPGSVNTALITLLVILLAKTHLGILFSTPVASQEVYQQQFQMHRFVTEYWQAPVAINDLGWVSYQNHNFVLDIHGLASYKTLMDRRSGNSVWMQDSIDRQRMAGRNVDLAMFYEDWYENVPEAWIKLGELTLSHDQVTAASDKVAFYATRPEAVEPIQEQLNRFIPTLPPGVRFVTPEEKKNPALDSDPCKPE